MENAIVIVAGSAQCQKVLGSLGYSLTEDFDLEVSMGRVQCNRLSRSVVVRLIGVGDGRTMGDVTERDM